MRSTSPQSPVALLVLALFGAGCTPTPPQPVSVDVQAVIARAWKRQQAAKPAVPTLPNAPPLLPASTHTLPAVAASSTAPARAAGASPEEVRATLDRDIARAQSELAARLRGVYATELRAVRFEREREIERLRRAGYGELIVALRDRFESYASDRAPLAARLAFLKGFPDPGPTLEPAASEVAKRREAEAKTLRERIAALDASFDAYVASLKDSTEASASAGLTELEGELARRRNELDAQAATEAQAQIRRLSADLDLRLRTRTPLRGAPLAAQTFVAPASTPLAAGPPEAAPKLASAERTARAALERRVRAELRIWSGLQNVDVRPRAAGIEDKTSEFERWRTPRVTGERG